MTLKIYLIYLSIMTIGTFLNYVLDKKKAERGAWRTPESVLLGTSFLGGALGGYLAMFLVRHKTRKWYFHLVNVIGILWQVALLIFLINNPDILF